MYCLYKQRRNNYISGLGQLFCFGLRYRKYKIVLTVLINDDYKHAYRIARLSRAISI